MRVELARFGDGQDSIQHGFFGRKGGVSTGVYSSLNCGLGSGDQQDAVLENRSRVAQVFGGDVAHLLQLKQCHSNHCLWLSSPFAMDAMRPQADAMATDVPGLMLGVLTADCGPVLFHGRKADGSPVVGAAHSGWGGALKGILESTVKSMCDHGARLSSIRAAVGPCIGKASYEVSVGFENPFLTRDPDDDIFFQAGTHPGKLFFDLPGYIARRLAACGVRDVTLSDLDTCALSADYFSYRRTTHQKEADYGRQISVISIG